MFLKLIVSIGCAIAISCRSRNPDNSGLKAIDPKNSIAFFDKSNFSEEGKQTLAIWGNPLRFPSKYDIKTYSPDPALDSWDGEKFRWEGGKFFLNEVSTENRRGSSEEVKLVDGVLRYLRTLQWTATTNTADNTLFDNPVFKKFSSITDKKEIATHIVRVVLVETGRKLPHQKSQNSECFVRVTIDVVDATNDSLYARSTGEIATKLNNNVDEFTKKCMSVPNVTDGFFDAIDKLPTS